MRASRSPIARRHSHRSSRWRRRSRRPGVRSSASSGSATRRERPMSALAPARARSRTGLVLLLIATIASIGAYAMVELGLKGRLPPDLPAYGLTLTGAFLLAWGAVRWMAPRSDPTLLPIAGMLGGLGLAMIYRLLPNRVADAQARWLLVGLA